MKPLRTTALLLALSASSFAAPARAEEKVPVGIEAFTSAVRDGNPTRLLSVWPRKGKVLLFGKKVDSQQASFKARFDDGVFELLHWPKGVAPAAPTEKQEKKQVVYAVHPEGRAGPLCTLRSAKGRPAELVACSE
jgi:hypothetical protein